MINLAGLIKKYKNKLFPLLRMEKHNYRYSTSIPIQSNLDRLFEKSDEIFVEEVKDLVETR